MLQSIFLTSLLIVTLTVMSVKNFSAQQEQVEMIGALKMLSNDVRRFAIENCSTASSYSSSEALDAGFVESDYAENIFDWQINFSRPGPPIIIVLEADKSVHKQILSVFNGESLTNRVAVPVPQSSHMVTPDLYPNISAETSDQTSGCI